MYLADRYDLIRTYTEGLNIKEEKEEKEVFQDWDKTTSETVDAAKEEISVEDKAEEDSEEGSETEESLEEAAETETAENGDETDNTEE